jgi:hypothetical protein
MVSLEQARQAKAAILQRLGGKSWVAGVGIAKGTSGFCVQVNVTSLSDEVRGAVPKEQNGVPVRVEQVGRIVAR